MSSLNINSFGIKKKGIKKAQVHHYYENGAHFKYQDLYTSLVNLYYSLPKERQGNMVNEIPHNGNQTLENISNNYVNTVPRYVKSVQENSRLLSKVNILDNKGKSCESNHKFFPFSKNKKLIEYRNFLKAIQNIKYKVSDKLPKKNTDNENINLNKLILNTVNEITELNPNKITLFKSINNEKIDGPILSKIIKRNKKLNYKLYNSDLSGISSFYQYRRPKSNFNSIQNPQMDKRENFK